MSWLQKVGRTLGLDPRHSFDKVKKGFEKVYNSDTAKRFGGRMKDIAVKHGGGFLKDTWNTAKKRGGEFINKAGKDIVSGNFENIPVHAGEGLKDAAMDVKDSAKSHIIGAGKDTLEAGGKAVSEGFDEARQALANNKQTRAAAKKSVIRKPRSDDGEIREL